MSKFIVLYYAPAEAMAQMANVTEEQRAEGMKPWMEWAQRCGDGLVDLGNPLANAQLLKPDGSSSPSGRDVTGYSILEASSIDEAKILLQGHPHLGWNADCDIELLEAVPM